MISYEVRQTFLHYFKERGHEVLRSASLIPVGDPTLLFTNAGMNPFKNIFLGKEERSFRRATSSQKCLRVSGKHNDFEQVGKTTRHHTFFEMLGNFSFGDYFKEEAIHFGWELVTEVYKIPEDRLWVTVFEEDEEAFKIWEKKIGLPSSRIITLGTKDNFWMMGETGPCGPCSEIHYDQGEGIGCGKDTCNVECDCDRFVELWNLVFIQFDRKESGKLETLPKPSIDTGMGLERISAILQNVTNNYETDLFWPIIEKLSEMTGFSYGSEKEVSFRVVADHARAVCFLIADGVVPTNDKRGYVLRRILRRGIRHGQFLGLSQPFFHHLIPIVVQNMGKAYPELIEAEKYIVEICQIEEERYARTLSTAVQLMEEVLSKLGPEEKTISGKKIFKLYDTYGLPLDLARDIAREEGRNIDEKEFEKELEQQRAKSSQWAKRALEKEGPDIYKEMAESYSIEFLGYEHDRVHDCRIMEIMKKGSSVDHLSKGEEGEILLDRTPFYAESGGQVGDQGHIVTERSRSQVWDTKTPFPGLIIHHVRVEEGSVQKGDQGTAEIDRWKRRGTMRNHTATHLLHAALREAVGPHIKQAGSLVEPDRLRFDFSHYAALPEKVMREIERIVNERIMEDIPVTIEKMPYKEAISKGAIALFGEKYGEMVRVVRVGEVSAELCGGTHCRRIGEIGPFKILSERSIGSGVRRIEAVTGEKALELFYEDHKSMDKIRMLLHIIKGDPAEAVHKKLLELKSLKKELDLIRMKEISDISGDHLEQEKIVDGHKVVVKRVDGLKKNEMRSLADRLKKKLKSAIIILLKMEERKVSFLVAVTEDLVRRYHAGRIVNEMAALMGGKGGGRADLAEGGGKEKEKMDEALEAGMRLIDKM